MDLHQLRCFVAAAEELHFGKAAHRLEMLPSALGRYIKLLEEDLGTRLMNRTTRSVVLTDDGTQLLRDARGLLAQADELAAKFRVRGRKHATTLRIGAIDSAAAGLLPLLMHDFRECRPDVTIELIEDKTVRLLPRLLSGRLDIAFVRPPEKSDKRLEFEFLFHETPVVVVSEHHPLALKKRLVIADLQNLSLIVPERRSRPHSHDLTIKLFAEAGLQPKIAQVADEKQTIVSLVAADLGIAIVPRWTSRMATKGVRFIPLKPPGSGATTKLPLAAAKIRDSRDAIRDELFATLQRKLTGYAEKA